MANSIALDLDSMVLIYPIVKDGVNITGSDLPIRVTLRDLIQFITDNPPTP